MANPTLVQVFGSNVTQSNNALTISKADLATVGLTVDANNRADQLFVAIILLAQQYLNATNQANNADIRVTIDSSYPSIVYKNGVNFRKDTYTVSMLKVDTTGSIDPDDY